jgi:GntR family transcriptional regulator, carbon starvation induced regulator
MCLQLAIIRNEEKLRLRVTQVRRRFAFVLPRVEENLPIDEMWEQQHRAYHFALVLGCGSSILLGFCAQLHDRLDRYRRLAIPVKSLMAGVGSDHDEIVEFALAGDAPSAAKLLDRHIAATAELVLQTWSDDKRGELLDLGHQSPSMSASPPRVCVLF